jgi:uncharacterized damage-inducible protein DinB
MESTSICSLRPGNLLQAAVRAARETTGNFDAGPGRGPIGLSANVYLDFRFSLDQEARMKNLTSLCAATLALLALPVSAQDARAPAAAAPAVATISNPAISGLKWPWSRVKDIVVRAAEKMPEEFYGFQPTPEVRTFGQLVGHLADSNVMLCSMALGEKKEPWTIEKTKTLKADLVAALKESIGVCDRVFAQGDADLAKGIALFGSDTTRFALVGLIIGHEFEHYGNMVTYMRVKGLVPPSSEPPPAKAPAPK